MPAEYDGLRQSASGLQLLPYRDMPIRDSICRSMSLHRNILRAAIYSVKDRKYRIWAGIKEDESVKFRPCIDIHNGKVKQIVGGSLRDTGDQARENFVSEQDAAFYAALYRDSGLQGGHVILLNPEDSPYYQETKKQALNALKTYPEGLQIGGGVCPENAEDYLDAGASHVIVTSYVFRNGRLSWENLEKIEKETGKEHLVLDLSCRKKNGAYYIVTDSLLIPQASARSVTVILERSFFSIIFFRASARALFVIVDIIPPCFDSGSYLSFFRLSNGIFPPKRSRALPTVTSSFPFP